MINRKLLDLAQENGLDSFEVSVYNFILEYFPHEIDRCFGESLINEDNEDKLRILLTDTNFEIEGFQAKYSTFDITQQSLFDEYISLMIEFGIPSHARGKVNS